MKVLRNILIAGCSTLLLCQCASQSDVQKLNRQLRSVNMKVDEVKTTTSSQMQKGRANSVNQLDTVAEETRQLQVLTEENKQVYNRSQEVNNQKFAQLFASMEQMRMENEQKMKQLEYRMEQLAGSLQLVSKAKVQEAERKAKAATRRAEAARKKTAMATNRTIHARSSGAAPVTVTPLSKKVRQSNGSVVTSPAAQPVTAPAPTRQATAASSPPPEQSVTQKTVEAAPAPAGSGLFGQGVNSYKAKKYKEAYKIFEQVMTTNPSNQQAAQALFYKGECLFNLNEFDLAILEYQKVISNYSKSAQSPAALLRQGMSFEKLTDRETAKIIYTKLLTDYPRSKEAAQGKTRLANL